MTYIDNRGKTLAGVTYSAALRRLHEMGAHNQIDEHDIAGEEALEEQQSWQQEALDTLDDFISSNETALDAIPAEANAGDYPEALWGADRDSDPSDPVNAIKIVFDMARQGAMDPNGPDAVELEDEIDAEQQAIDMTFDILALHSDQLAAIRTARFS